MYVGIGNITGEVQIENISFAKKYAVALKNIQFEKAELTATASANILYKCPQWDFINEICPGAWEKFRDLIPGEHYGLVLIEENSGFAEGNMLIENKSADEPTNQTLNLTNITGLIFISSIPNITLAINERAAINLSNHFLNIDENSIFTYLNLGDLNITFQNGIANIIPAEDFIGSLYTFITANSSNNLAVSNVFRIEVINGAIAPTVVTFNFTDPLIQLKLKEYADLNLKPSLNYDSIIFTGYEIKNDIVITYATVDGKETKWLTSLNNFQDAIVS